MKRNRKKIEAPMIPVTADKLDKVDMRGLISTDPQGSYTGRPMDIMDTPVQDADDL